MPPRAVLFDLDGVLVDTYEAWFALVRDTARHFGAPDVSRAAFDTTWGQSVEDDSRDLVPGPTVEQVARYYTEHFADHARRMVVDPEARRTLESLRARGIATGCVTNSPAPLAREILRAADLDGLVDVVVAAGDVPRPKPAPDMILAACARLGLPPAQAVLVGDSVFDEQAARAGGCAFVRYDVRERRSLAGTIAHILGEPGGTG